MRSLQHTMRWCDPGDETRGGLAVVEARGRGEEERTALRALLAEHGAVLIRGPGLRHLDEFGAVVAGLMTEVIQEREGFAPREDLGNGVYSSVLWPPDQPLCMHHELSYVAGCPGTVAFFHLRAPDSGGRTGVADATAVLRALPGDVVDRFAREGWQLVRNYNDLVGVPWRDAFGMTARAAVEDYCVRNGIEYEWLPGDGLRTRQRRAAVVTHPGTGMPCWFNQIAFLNEWTMEPGVRDFLVSEFGPDAIPFTTRYGHGSPVEPDVVARINDVYDEHTVSVPWQAGDVLLVDNIRTAHSRDSYTGGREVLVAMGDPAPPQMTTWEDR